MARCPDCGLAFERDEGSRLGSAMVNYGVVAVALMVYLVAGFVLTLPDPPLLGMLAGAVLVVVVVALVFFPFAKTTWSAIDLLIHGFDAEDRPPRADGGL